MMAAIKPYVSQEGISEVPAPREARAPDIGVAISGVFGPMVEQWDRTRRALQEAEINAQAVQTFTDIKLGAEQWSKQKDEDPNQVSRGAEFLGVVSSQIDTRLEPLKRSRPLDYQRLRGEMLSWAGNHAVVQEAQGFKIRYDQLQAGLDRTTKDALSRITQAPSGSNIDVQERKDLEAQIAAQTWMPESHRVELTQKLMQAADHGQMLHEGHLMPRTTIERLDDPKHWPNLTMEQREGAVIHLTNLANHREHQAEQELKQIQRQQMLSLASEIIMDKGPVDAEAYQLRALAISDESLAHVNSILTSKLKRVEVADEKSSSRKADKYIGDVFSEAMKPHPDFESVMRRAQLDPEINDHGKDRVYGVYFRMGDREMRLLKAEEVAARREANELEKNKAKELREEKEREKKALKIFDAYFPTQKDPAMWMVDDYHEIRSKYQIGIADDVFKGKHPEQAAAEARPAALIAIFHGAEAGLKDRASKLQQFKLTYGSGKDRLAALRYDISQLRGKIPAEEYVRLVDYFEDIKNFEVWKAANPLPKENPSANPR